MLLNVPILKIFICHQEFEHSNESILLSILLTDVVDDKIIFALPCVIAMFGPVLA